MAELGYLTAQQTTSFRSSWSCTCVCLTNVLAWHWTWHILVTCQPVRGGRSSTEVVAWSDSSVSQCVSTELYAYIRFVDKDPGQAVASEPVLTALMPFPAVSLCRLLVVTCRALDLHK